MARRLKASDPTKATPRKPEEVEVRNIAHPLVWATAMKVAGNRRDKITVVLFSHVTVNV